jgi:hypothetical protein
LNVYDPIRDLVREHAVAKLPFGPGDEMFGPIMIPRRWHSVHTASLNRTGTGNMTINQINEVRDKVAIVTGAASGMGKATVELLHARGAKVIAEDIDPAVNDLTRPGIVPFVADVSKDGSRKSCRFGAGKLWQARPSGE